MPDDALVIAAESSTLTVRGSACSTLFDPNARVETFTVPALLARVDEELAAGLAVDIWAGDRVDDLRPRVADSVALDDGFRASGGDLFEGALRLPLSPGAYVLRLRRLLDGAVSAPSEVVVSESQ